MRLGFSTHFYVHERLDTIHIDEIKSLGYEEIELWGMPPVLDLTDKERIKRVKEYLEEKGIRVISFHGPLYKRTADPASREWLYLSSSKENKRKEAVEKNIEIIRLIEDFKASILVLHIDLEEGADTRQAINNFRKSLEELIGETSKKGIRIAIENTHEHTVSGKLRELISTYPERDVGICLDIGHANIFEDPSDAIKIAGERLIHTHLHDNDGNSDLHLWVGRGDIDWKSVTKAASEINYQGVLMLELRKEKSLAGLEADNMSKILGI